MKHLSRLRVFLVFSLITISIFVISQNCAKKDITGLIEEESALSTEDDIWNRIDSAKTKITQLEALTEYSDSHQIVGKSPASLSKELKSTVDNLENMILVQKLPTNTQVVIKKYTSLVDLLSEARDILILYYSRLDLAEFQDSLNLLSGNFSNLSSTVSELGVKFSEYQKANDKKLESVIGDLNNEVLRVDHFATVLSTATSDIDLIKSKLVPDLQNLASNTAENFNNFKLQIEALRSAGDSAYTEALSSWSCKDDISFAVNKQMFHLTGDITEACLVNHEQVLYDICRKAYPTFCGTCTDIASSGDCPAWTDPNSANGLTAREKLGILIDIQQQISIESLKNRVALHEATLFGNTSCKDGTNGKENCLLVPSAGQSLPATCNNAWKDCGMIGQIFSLHMNDLDLQNNIQLVQNNLSTQFDNFKNNFDIEKASVHAQLELIVKNFDTEKSFTASRFSALSQSIDSKLAQYQAQVDTRMQQLAGAITGKMYVSPTLAEDIAKAMAQSTAGKLREFTFTQSVSTTLHSNFLGWNAIPVEQIDNEIALPRDGVIKYLAEGSVTGSGANPGLVQIVNTLIKDVFDSLRADQNNLPQYDSDLASAVGSVCSGFINKTPFTNVVDRDSMNLLAIGLMRRIMFGDGPSTVTGVSDNIFAPYQSPLVKNSLLQKLFVGALFDYRADITVSVNSQCLDAIDDWAKYVFANNRLGISLPTQQTVHQLLNNPTVVQDMRSFADQLTIVLDNLAELERLIALRAPMPNPTSEVDAYNAYKDTLMLVINALVGAGKALFDKNLADTDYAKLFEMQKALLNQPSYITDVQETINSFKAAQNQMVTSLGTLSTALFAEMASNYTVLDSKINTVNNSLAASMGTLSSSLALTQASFAEYQAATQLIIDKLIATQSTFQAQLTADQATLVNLQAEQTATAAALSTTQASLSAYQTANNLTLEELQASQEATVVTLLATQASLSNYQATTQTTIGSLQSVVTSTQTALTATQGSLASIQTTMSNLQTNLTATQGSLATTIGSLNQLQALEVEAAYFSLISATNLTADQYKKLSDDLVAKYWTQLQALGAKTDGTGLILNNDQLYPNDTFTPQITGIKHMFENYSSSCSETALNALSNTSPGIVQNSWICDANFRSTSASTINTTWFRFWGAMRKLKVDFDGQSYTIDYSNLKAGDQQTTISGSVVKFRTPDNWGSGSTFALGSFTVNIVDLFKSWISNWKGNYATITFTPIKLTNDGQTPVSGTAVDYTLHLYSPLVLSLNSDIDSIETISTFNGMQYDLMGNGQKQNVGWIRPQFGGFLVIDLNKNNLIDNGTEMFGQSTYLNGTKDIKAENGFIALSQYDNNGDGIINKSDKAFEDLKVWFDLNTDGYSQTNEIVKLTSLGIVELNTNYSTVPVEKQLNNGNRIVYQSKFSGPKQCGSKGCNIYDIYFMSGRMDKVVSTQK